MDRLTKEQRHKNMSKIKSKDTSIEMRLRKALWKEGIHYRKTILICRESRILCLQNIKLRFFVIASFFMERIGRF